MTNLRQFELKNKRIPAGIIEGTEAFWFDEEKWLIHQGEAMKFNEAPIKLRDMIAESFLCDTHSITYLKKIGISGFVEGFEMWYRCVIGGIDENPDFVSDKLHADAFNNQCKDYDCPHRGKFCGRASGLNHIEVQTLSALKRGDNFRQTAASLYVSNAGLKSRVTKLRQKLEAKNTAALTARAAEIGI
jgi:DNA-binding CsgD family transcriptional regulator